MCYFIFGGLRASLRKHVVLLFTALGLVGGWLLSDEALRPDQRRWLDDISPIITRTEKDVFLKLRTDQERDKFIRLFWRMRDPLPETPENEFQKEYMKRVEFADQNFGHGSSRRGSQTERGFYYLLLGPPLERSQYTTQSEFLPLELWFYKGQVEYGLPDYFYLIFYQPQGLGEFRLYNPGHEGPETLVIPLAAGQQMTRSAAFQIMKKTSAELAGAALSYLPGERPGGIESFSSDMIIASIKQLPDKKFSDAYARTYMTYKDYVETEYSDNFIDSTFQLKLFKESGQPFVHWSIEPEKMNFAISGDTAYAGFELVLKMEDLKGNSILEKIEPIPVKMTLEQYKAHERQRFAFQDILPVIPGEYKLLLLLKNRTGKDFTSHETRILVPGEGQAGFSSLLLHHGRKPVPETQRSNLKAFVLGGTQFLVGTRNEFLAAEKMGIFLQAFNPDKLGLPAQLHFVFEIFPSESEKSVIRTPLSVEAGQENVRSVPLTGTADLSSLKPGYYRAEASAVTPDGQKVLTQKDNFVILAQPFPVMPWSRAALHGRFPGEEHLRILGTQYFLAKEYERAKAVLQQALEFKDDAGARLLLAKTFFAIGRFRDSLDQALPLYEKAPDREAAKVIALDYVGLKDWNSSLVYLDKLLAEATEVSVLNLAAECHLNLGHPEKALPLLQKSLSLVPDQPSIKELEERAKKSLGQR
jgi:GWxTD domain-containing protein